VPALATRRRQELDDLLLKQVAVLRLELDGPLRVHDAQHLKRRDAGVRLL
jgi:hypothetical protein